MKELLKGFINPGLGLRRRVSLFGEEIAIGSGLERAFAIAGMALDFAERSIHVRWRRLERWGWRLTERGNSTTAEEQQCKSFHLQRNG